jgi:cytochrome c551
MRIELKALIAAVIGGLAVVGAAFGVSAIVLSVQPKPTQSSATPKLNSPQVAQGHAFFKQSCASCHGTDGVGAFGPNLHNEDMSNTQIAQTIQNGVDGKMPPFQNKYNSNQTQALVAYIRTLK